MYFRAESESLIFHFFLEVPLETNPKKSIDTCHFPFICSLQALKHDDLYEANHFYICDPGDCYQSHQDSS